MRRTNKGYVLSKVNRELRAAVQFNDADLERELKPLGKVIKAVEDKKSETLTLLVKLSTDDPAIIAQALARLYNEEVSTFEAVKPGVIKLVKDGYTG